MGEENDLERRKNGSLHRGIGSVQRLLDSFPMRKNAELREFVRDSKIQERDLPADDPLAEVFALTRKLLSKTAGILNFRLLKDDDFLESGLGEGPLPPALLHSPRPLEKKIYSVHAGSPGAFDSLDYLPLWFPENKQTSSQSRTLVQGAEAQTATRRQNRQWCVPSPRGSYAGCCPRGRFLDAHEGVALVPAFLCGTPGKRSKGTFTRRILAARIGPTLGSTGEFIPIFERQ